MTAAEAGGIINVAKPIGLTSFGVVARVRRMMGFRHVGHCGTLDPFAEGVLPILLGKATGAARYMENYGKSYRVVVRFGTFTDTQDLTGRPVGGRTPTAGELEAMRMDGYQLLRGAVDSLMGDRLQTPPMYSAVKIDGKHLYEYARKGIDVERTGRLIHIYRADILGISADGDSLEMTVDFDCSKGTYIRTLCQDLGELTGFGAHAAALVRTACGPFSITGAISLEQLGQMTSDAGEDRIKNLRDAGILLPVEYAFPDMLSAHADGDTALRFIQGRPITASEAGLAENVLSDTRVALHGPGGFVGVGMIRRDAEDRTFLYAERVFADREDYQKRV